MSDGRDVTRRDMMVAAGGAVGMLLIPLTVGVAVVYKSIKCRKMSKVLRESTELTLWILLFMVIAAVVLTGLVRGVEHWID